jgi:hypothetical protein
MAVAFVLCESVLPQASQRQGRLPTIVLSKETQKPMILTARRRRGGDSRWRQNERVDSSNKTADVWHFFRLD